MNEIKLDLPKDIIALAGFPYGNKIYNEQLKEKIEKDNINIIVFPDNIEIVASSFVQGLFGELINEIGVDKIVKIVMIKAANEELANSIVESIF